MELKQENTKLRLHSLIWFNRTFMELKQTNARNLSPERLWFNRTFMELKRHSAFVAAASDTEV